MFNVFRRRPSGGQSVGWLVGQLVCRFVGQSACWSVGRSVALYFFYDSISLTSLLLPKWSSDLKFGPCPPARDFGSRVSSLVFMHFATIKALAKKKNILILAFEIIIQGKDGVQRKKRFRQGPRGYEMHKIPIIRFQFTLLPHWTGTHYPWSGPPNEIQ